MGEVILRHEQKSRGILVDPVHDAGAYLPADAGELVQMLEQGVHHRAVRVARRGMHHHAAGLVHHGEIAVLVDDVQVDILRLDG